MHNYPQIRDHQVQAINATLDHFQNHRRAQIQMACGTGKTLVCFEIAKELVPVTGDGNILVLFPNLNLIAQTLRAWKNYGVEGVLAFCSDLSEIDCAEVAHTTDAAELLDRMSGINGRKIIFSTYHSTPNLVDAGLPVWDLIIFDEAHRAAGSSDSAFSTAVNNDKIPAMRRFFATATPRIAASVTGMEEADNEDVLGFDMDDTERFGERVFEYSHQEAVNDGWINDFKLALVAITQKEIAEAIITEGKSSDLTQIAAAIALSKATREHHLRSTLTYHSRVEAAENFARLLKAVDSKISNDSALTLETFSVSGRDSANADRVLERIRCSTDSERLVVSNCMLLGEGVDVPGLDSLAFIDPRSSAIAVTQAIGRIVRLNNGVKRDGFVLLPVIVDALEATIDQTEEAIDRANFTMVYATLNALQALDPRISDELMISSARHSLKSSAGHENALQETLGSSPERLEGGNGSAVDSEGAESDQVLLSNRVIGLGEDFNREEIISSIHAVFAARRSPRDTHRYKEDMYQFLVTESGFSEEDALLHSTTVHNLIVAERANARKA